MLSKLLNTIDQIIQKPRQLFFVDFVGALITAFITGFVLVKYEFHFGMPRLILIPMAFMACLMAVYSLLCSILLKKRFGPFLLMIVTLNVLFCLCSWWMVYSFRELITPLGYAHYTLETIVVLAVVSIEIKAYLRLK